MNSRNHVSSYQEQIKDLFLEMAPDAISGVWADSFEIDSVDRKCVKVVYYGDKKIKKFKKACMGMLQSCAWIVTGEKKKIKITRRAKETTLSPGVKKNIRAAKFFIIGMIFVSIAAASIIVLCSYLENRNFRETFYITSSIKVDSPVRVIQLSDLYAASYGEDNSKLLTRIRALEPDVIICTGDMVNSIWDDRDQAVSLAHELARIAPAYYVYGNNEVECIYDVPLNQTELDQKFGFDQHNRDETALLKVEDPFEEALEATGIKVLKNEKDTIQVGTMKVDIYGVLNSNPSSFWSYSEKAFLGYLYEDTDNLKITAVHEPAIFEAFAPEFWGDLLLCGHTHGGVMRVPVLGPLYTHEGGLFPERSGCFVYGRYDAAGCPLIVSSGLENMNLLRINNQPELVVIDINKF